MTEESEAAKKRRERFAEYFVTSWAAVENIVNLMLIDSSGALFDEEKSEKLRRKNFKNKMDILKKEGFLSDNDYNDLKAFSEIRNNIFHGGLVFAATIRDSNAKDGAIAITLKGVRTAALVFAKFVKDATGRES